MNAGKSKVMAFERREAEVFNFNTRYKMSMPTVGRCELLLGRERMEEVKEFKYLETVLYKHGKVEGKLRERAGKGRCVSFEIVG